MTEVKAIAKNIRVSPKKARIPVDAVKGMFVDDALAVLKYMEKKVAGDVYKVVNSARANAVNNNGLTSGNLYIYSLTVNEGRKMKRFKPAARGSVRPILRRSSHIQVVLRDITDVENKKEEIKEVKKDTKATETKKENKKVAKPKKTVAKVSTKKVTSTKKKVAKK